MAQELARYYDVPCINLQEVVRELCETQEEWNEYGEAIVGDVPAEVLRKMMHIKLEQHSCKWHGYVFDGMQMNNIELRNLFSEIPDPEAAPPEEDEPAVVLNLLPKYTPNTVVWMTMDDEELKERLKTELCLEMEEEEVDVKIEAYSAQLEDYRALEAAASGEAAADAAPAKGKKPAKGAADAPAEVLKLGKELFTDKLPENKFVFMKPAEWPDTSMQVCLVYVCKQQLSAHVLQIRQAIGVPKNISGPGSLLSDEWVPVVEEVEPDPEPLGVPPAIAAVADTG